MRGARGFALAVALVLACAMSAANLRAQTADPVATDKAAADPLAVLPADLHTKVDGIMEKAAEAKRATYARQMKEVTASLVTTTGVTGNDALQALAVAARDAGEESVRECIVLARKRIGRGYQRIPAQMAMSINNTVGTGGLAAARSEGETPPDEQPGWTAALRRVLTPEQFAAWTTKGAADRAREDQEIDKLLDPQMDRLREELGAAMRARIAELTVTLDLPPDRAEKLDALGRAAVEQSLRAYRLTAARTLRSVLPAEQRPRFIALNGLPFTTQGDDAPANQVVWKAGLDALFTPADRQRLRELQDERHTRRVRVLGQMMLAVIDENVALTTPQRERLQGPAERAVQSEATLFAFYDTDSVYVLPREAFLQAAGRVTEAEAWPVLDPGQWQHWQQACRDAADGKGNPGLHRLPRQGLPDRNDPPPAALEPEEIERQLSDGLDAKTREERQRLLAVTLLKVEDAARVAGLDETVANRLRTAARGTAEEALAVWKASVSQNVRSQLENGDQENLRAMLAGLSDLQFSQGYSPQDPPPTLYDKTVEHELTAPQRAAWQREVDARAAYKDAAIVSLVLAEFDGRYLLTAAQWDKLLPLLGQVMQSYSPDMHRLFAYSAANAPWYLQSFTMFLPLQGIPEDELETVLGKERWERWASSQEHANGNHYWRNVVMFHDQRKKEVGQ